MVSCELWRDSGCASIPLSRRFPEWPMPERPRLHSRILNSPIQGSSYRLHRQQSSFLPVSSRFAAPPGESRIQISTRGGAIVIVVIRIGTRIVEQIGFLYASAHTVAARRTVGPSANPVPGRKSGMATGSVFSKPTASVPPSISRSETAIIKKTGIPWASLRRMSFRGIDEAGQVSDKWASVTLGYQKEAQ